MDDVTPFERGFPAPTGNKAFVRLEVGILPEDWEFLVPPSRFNEARPPVVLASDLPAVYAQWGCGDGGIRTHGTRFLQERVQTVYKTAALNHSATSPSKAEPLGSAFCAYTLSRNTSNPLLSPLSNDLT
jgi:hypothetical protein